MSTSAEIDRSTPPPPGPLRPFDFPEIESFRLSNGIPVLFAPTPGFGVATLSVLVRAGGAHEAASHAGLASLTASLLESGAGDREGVRIADEIERLGIDLDTGSSWDATHLGMTGLSSRMVPASGIGADLVRRPTFPESEVARLRQEQLARIMQRRAEPRSLANEMIARFVFSEESPYSRPLDGTPDTVERLTRADIVDFHAGRFSAGASALVMAGDLTVDTAARLAEEGFGSWSAEAPEPVSTRSEARSDSVELVVVDRPGSVQSEIRVGHVGVARDTPAYFPLTVMNAILGGAFSSRLNMNLRERRGFTYGVSSSFVMRRQPGPFLVSTAVQTEVTAPALSEIFTELHGIRSESVTSAELDDARSYLAGIFPLRLQTTGGVASRLAELALYDLPLGYFDDYRQRIMAVTRQQVLEAAQAFVQPDRAVALVVGDAATIREPLEGLGLGPVRVLDAEGRS